MTTIVDYLTQDHDPRLTLLALGVCVVGSVLTARILGGLLKTGGLRKRYKWYMSSLIAGTTAWTTHFVAMLAYDPGVPHGYDAGLTAKSLLVSLAGMVLAIGLFSHGRL